MRGFVLAAGFGTRMRPITNYIPKALVPVCGKSLLERALDFVSSGGIRTIGVNAHFLPGYISEFQKNSTVPFQLFIEEGEIRGTGGAFDYAREFLSGDDSFFILNVDILCKFDLNGAIKKFESSDALMMLCAFPSENGSGTVFYDQKTGEYRGTPSDLIAGNDSLDAAFIGAAFYRKEIMHHITSKDFSIVPVWKRLVESGHKVMVEIINEGYWRDIGTPQALADIHFEVLDKKLEIDIPPYLHVDYLKKWCVNMNHKSKLGKVSGEYAWIESSFSEFSNINRSIIFPGAYPESTMLNNTILTSWGALPIK
jgi:mannose-1-phosphate guanylyltransferase